MTIDPDRYTHLLTEKEHTVKKLFSCFSPPELQVYASPPTHYRMRAEFRIWHHHKRHQFDYIMFTPGSNERVIVQSFTLGSYSINSIMPRLRDTLQQDPILSNKLFQIEFLTAKSGRPLVTLVYHRALDAVWLQSAQALENALCIHVVGRSRKQKVVVSQDFITDTFIVGHKTLCYRQYENSFTQPNASINQMMLQWCHETTQTTHHNEDLLELYCGNGNFTCALAPHFNKVLATEISKTAIAAARHNIQHNQITNTQVVRMSAHEVAQALQKVRPFRRLAHIPLDTFSFKTIFCDPPRSGLDPITRDFIQSFDHIIYISCNYETLYRDLQSLCLDHNMTAFALFDQFPYTPHIEIGVYLQRKKNI